MSNEPLAITEDRTPEQIKAEVRGQVAEIISRNADLLDIAADVLRMEGMIGDEEIDWEAANRIEIDECEFGDKVRICWNINGDRFSDVGYLTCLPNIGDGHEMALTAFIHVPCPNGYGCKKNPDQEFLSVLSAIKNPMIVSIKPIRRR